MSIFLLVLKALALLIALLLLLALFMKRAHYVRRAVIIDAPLQQVFAYIRLLKNQDAFNEGAMAGTDREKTYQGEDGTAGFVYAWKGNRQAGEGEKEIIRIEEDKLIEAEIRFVKPMKVKATIVMETEALGAHQTRVYWSNAGLLPYPFNLLIPVMQKSVGRGMDTSLQRLKAILEA